MDEQSPDGHINESDTLPDDFRNEPAETEGLVLVHHGKRSLHQDHVAFPGFLESLSIHENEIVTIG